MNKKKIIKDRLLDALECSPEFCDIMLASDNLETKRANIFRFLADRHTKTFEDNLPISTMEWILSRDAIQVLGNILSQRSEKLAGYSMIGYMNDILHETPLPQGEPSPGFFAEIKHLIQGVTAKTGVYNEAPPDFLEYEGRQAAILRSEDLSRMAQIAQDRMTAYRSGLTPDVIRRRFRNRQRILKYFKATDLEWSNWKWHTKNIIRDVSTLRQLIRLSQEEIQAVTMANKHRIPFGITPYYLSLMDYDSKRTHDYAVRAQVIPPLDYVEKLHQGKTSGEYSMDFMMEGDTSPVDGITRRYPMIVILKPILTCPQICVYCQRNWEIKDVYSKHAVMSDKKLGKAIQWIADTPEIREVLITGGDPLLLSNRRIENLLFRLSRIKHVERIRIGTRTLVTLPQRITDSLARDIGHFHAPGKREITIVTHFEHPYEVTPAAKDAVQKFRQYGMEVKNQLVFTTYNSRKFEAAFLRHLLALIGVSPYYTFNTKGKEETDAYRVPIARLMQEHDEEARLMPGTVRTDNVVFNLPGLGKNNLMSTQHHKVISIRPDGRRMYEFHPWEKKLALMDTYIYTDVGIHDYLEKLKAWGEDLANYKTIWYYY